MGATDRRLRLRWVILGIGGVALVVAGLVMLVARGPDARRASVGEAIERYHASTTVAGAALGRPAQGVYSLTGTGTEKLSFQTSGQTMGPTMPATVTWKGDRCWDLRVDYSANHWQTWRYCIDGDQVADGGGTVFQRFDLVVARPETTSVAVCEPPVPSVRRGVSPGTTWSDRCTITVDGATTELTGTVAFVGSEPVTVAGASVPALHDRYERRYTGAQRGEATLDTWYALDTGMPLRSRWTLRMTSGSPIGDVTYTESGEWAIDSLTPQS